MEQQARNSNENTWLLRIITGMLSFTSLVVMLMLNTLIKRLDDQSRFNVETTKELAEHDTWIKTFDNSQRRMEGNFDKWVGNKLYAMKPDDITIKRENQ